MRIVGGEFRGRKLLSPNSQNIRPTTDRIKESLFNVLVHNYPEYLKQTRVLDLFAGTGALGIEALSRGAGFCQFVENSAEGVGILRKNLNKIGLNERTSIVKSDATHLATIGSQTPFNLVFADPPYSKGFGEKAAACLISGQWLTAQAILVLEENPKNAPDQLPGFERLYQKTCAGTAIGIFRIDGST